jgi:hypothetical protein
MTGCDLVMDFAMISELPRRAAHCQKKPCRIQMYATDVADRSLRAQEISYHRWASLTKNVTSHSLKR